MNRKSNKTQEANVEAKHSFSDPHVCAVGSQRLKRRPKPESCLVLKMRRIENEKENEKHLWTMEMNAQDALCLQLTLCL